MVNKHKHNNTHSLPIHAVVVEILGIAPLHPVDDLAPAHSHHLVVAAKVADEIVSILLLLVAVDQARLTTIIPDLIVDGVHREVDLHHIVEGVLLPAHAVLYVDPKSLNLASLNLTKLSNLIEYEVRYFLIRANTSAESYIICGWRHQSYL